MWCRWRYDGAGIGGGGTYGESGDQMGEGREKRFITVGYVPEYGGLYG